MGNRRTDFSMIISVSAGGKHEQKSLRDREGPHRSPGLILKHFWTAVTYYTLLSVLHRLFIQLLPGEYYNQSVLQHVCVYWWGQLLDLWMPMLMCRSLDLIVCACVCSWLTHIHNTPVLTRSVCCWYCVSEYMFYPSTSPTSTCRYPKGWFVLITSCAFICCSIRGTDKTPSHQKLY